VLLPQYVSQLAEVVHIVIDATHRRTTGSRHPS
jgi:hypothetical protein